MLTNMFRGAVAILFLLGCLACVPQIVIIDRYSVIEEESAGDWPEMEADLRLLNARVRPARETVTDAFERKESQRALGVMPLGRAETKLKTESGR